jgi:dCTP deaminase
MLLSYHELHELIEQGVITADPANVNGASIDVTLHEDILVEQYYSGEHRPIINLMEKQAPEMVPTKMHTTGFLLYPHQFILASTNEVFNLPNDIVCEFKLKSSGARAGLNNMLATYCDPEWSNSRLTLELMNCLQHHILRLRPNMKIGQMIFYRVKPVPHEHSYAVKGRYNDTLTVTGSKGV